MLHNKLACTFMYFVKNTIERYVDVYVFVCTQYQNKDLYVKINQIIEVVNVPSFIYKYEQNIRTSLHILVFIFDTSLFFGVTST